MPKYYPTEEDIYSTKPCFICGKDILDNNDTCGHWICEQQFEIFKEDFERELMERYYSD